MIRLVQVMRVILRTIFVCCTALLFGCAVQSGNRDNVVDVPDIIAVNAFYYYEDVDAAWQFYDDTLGLQTVVDYGFAKILRLADTSYITLVQADSGMHDTSEPKTVTLSLITDELDRWRQHFDADSTVTIDDLHDRADSFVVRDPEGYALRFLRYNPHPVHENFIAAVAAVSPLAVEWDGLSIRATIYSAYFESLQEVSPFYDSLFGAPASETFKTAPLHALSRSGYLALIGGGDELHSATEDNAVTYSFLTTDVDAWFEHANQQDGFVLRTPEVLNEGDRVKVFVGYDPSGIFLEWDTFLDVEDNVQLIELLDH